MRITQIKNSHALTLVELMIVILISAVIFTGGYVIMMTGQSTWFTAEAGIDLQDNMRLAIEKTVREIRETQTGHLQIFNNTGINNTDIIRFSVPVTCHAGDSLINTNGDVAYWGAPLSWGCTASTCMDANNNCATVEYKYIEYYMDSSNRLMRRILNGVPATVREDAVANYVTDLQFALNGSVVTMNISAQKLSGMHRLIPTQRTVNVYLRN